MKLTTILIIIFAGVISFLGNALLHYMAKQVNAKSSETKKISHVFLDISRVTSEYRRLVPGGWAMKAYWALCIMLFLCLIAFAASVGMLQPLAQSGR
jgi:hypothetical protein